MHRRQAGRNSITAIRYGQDPPFEMSRHVMMDHQIHVVATMRTAEILLEDKLCGVIKELESFQSQAWKRLVQATFSASCRCLQLTVSF